MIKGGVVKKWQDESVREIIDEVEMTGILDEGNERLLRLKLPLLKKYKKGDLDKTIYSIKESAKFFQQHKQYVLEKED